MLCARVCLFVCVVVGLFPCIVGICGLSYVRFGRMCIATCVLGVVVF